jgi:hypothetical protein
VGPIQVWPHGFDLSFEWFGTRMVETEGERSSSQLNLGFYPAGDPYFHSSPWPFDESLTTAPLPPGAVWNTDGWSGARLPYSPLVGDPAAGSKVADFARAVFAAAAPTLGA